MRLVAWNANQNNHRRRKFRDVAAMLEPFHADLLVISESPEPTELLPGKVHWVGRPGSPGLAVVAGKRYRLVSSAKNDGAPTYFSGFAVEGPVAFNLVAAWTTPLDKSESYHSLLMTALDYFRDELRHDNAVLAGDLNSSTRVIKQKATHPKFVEQARKLRLQSAYHSQSGEEHGHESTPTFIRGAKSTKRGFHIDYCFASKRLVDAASVSILRGGDWSKRSDHFPLVLDIPDDSFQG